MAGFMINSRGTTIMIDPLLGGFDNPQDQHQPCSTNKLNNTTAVGTMLLRADPLRGLDRLTQQVLDATGTRPRWGR